MIKKLSFSKSDLFEHYVMALLTVGLPLVALAYSDWRAALATFVVVQITIGLLALKAPKEAPKVEAE